MHVHRTGHGAQRDRYLKEERMGKTIYLVWKDPSATKTPDNWKELSAEEFFDFRKSPESEGRYFIRMGDDMHDDSDVIFIEATEEQYRDWRRECAKHCYLDQQAEGVQFVSTEMMVTSDETLGGVIPDEAAVPEEELVRRKMQEALVTAIRELEPGDQELLMTIIKDFVPTLRDLSRERGKPYNTLWNRRERLKEALRKKMKHWK